MKFHYLKLSPVVFILNLFKAGLGFFFYSLAIPYDG
ncbi:hypothetical protein EDC63_101324 [Sulfurirhabdus autotrophica]|uniref:Uncharacterized protein n=1 Tax=Sulfurirhabdus autotrophica TaxID=1706046 RepID=A0A4R3YHA3_9PROT|nr:hypothetical protein EDC63_101324 [Sulfurirhabdus autotrophica]